MNNLKNGWKNGFGNSWMTMFNWLANEREDAECLLLGAGRDDTSHVGEKKLMIARGLGRKVIRL